jgi:hypothetical protein
LQLWAQRPIAWLGLAAALIFAVLAAGGLLATTAPPAFAQERVRGWTLRDLFFPRRYQRVDPRDDVARPRRKVKQRARPRKPAIVEPEIVIEPKADDAKTVLVVGDFIASDLAEGLDMLFASNTRVRIADRTNNASGFVRDDHFDWPGKIGEIVAAEKPAVVVVLIGANDRQQMRIADKREPVRSEAWAREYSARAANFASAVSVSEVPLVWVGTIPFKSTKSSSDMLALNEIYARVASDVGAEFIDVWDGFADEKGAFVVTGPDISGQPARLRSSDGVNLTTAGKRKLAFYTEKTLKRLLGEAGLGEPALPGAEGVPSAGLGPGMPTDRTMPIALTDPALDGGAELLGATVTVKTPGPGPEQAPEQSAVPVPAAGRVDDFSWRGKAASTTLPPISRSADTTASTRAGVPAAPATTD